MEPPKAYILCTAPRSGSTLLCRMLTETGVAGRPASYFHEPCVADWAARLDLAPGNDADDRALQVSVLRAAQDKGRNGAGPFGLRLQRHSFPYFMERLEDIFPDERTDTERLRRAFGATAFIYLTRADKVEQAVSYAKARQSGLWHVAPDGTEQERLAPRAEPVYDAAEIAEQVETFAQYDRDWESWFAGQGLEPLRIGYEDLSADPQQMLRRTLEVLGLDGRAADGIGPGVGKLADDVSRDWVARFKATRAVD